MTRHGRYFPPAQMFFDQLKLMEASPENHFVCISFELMKKLISSALESAPFDEKIYVERNPDLMKAWHEGKIADLHEHYKQVGYFEGRIASTIDVDEEWYLATYRDVRVQVDNGTLMSGREHYIRTGLKEWRSPNPAVADAVASWHRLIAQILK